VSFTYLSNELTAGACSVKNKLNREFYRVPDSGTIASMVHLVQSSSLADEIIELLILQLNDEHEIAALGALIVLDRLGRVPDGRTFSIADIHSLNLKLSSKMILRINSSYVMDLDCKKCDVVISQSLFDGGQTNSLRGQFNYINAVPPQKLIWEPKHNIFDFRTRKHSQDHDFSLVEGITQFGNTLSEGDKKITKDFDAKVEASCKDIEQFCKYNEIFDCSGF